MELGGVREYEVAVVGVGQDAFVDQAMTLEEDRGYVGHVPMADVGGENRLQARAHRIAACVERAIDAQVVGLATEVEVAEDSREVVLLADARVRPFVAIRGAIMTLDTFVVSPRRARRILRDELGPAIFREQLMQARAIEPRRIVVHESGKIALFPMLLERMEQVAGPSGAAFEEAEAEFGKSRRHSAHHDRAA